MNNRKLILACLRTAGQRGVTNLTLNNICFRYGARIHELRRQGHNIQTVQDGNGVFRYVLNEGA